MAFYNDFGVEIVTMPNLYSTESFVQDNAHYVDLPNDTAYAIRLINRHNVRTDAYVWVDGDSIGGFVLNPYSSETIRRPGQIDKQFVFFSERSPESLMAGVSPGDPNNGLIRVIFKPQKPIRYTRIRSPPRMVLSPQRMRMGAVTTGLPSPSMLPTVSPIASSTQMALPSIGAHRAMISARGPYESGATLLGGASHQEFNKVPPLRKDEIDESNETEILVRLIARRPGYERACPNPPYCTPYPPRIESRFYNY